MFIPTEWRTKFANIDIDDEGMSAAEVLKCHLENEIVYIKSIDNKYSKTTYSVHREKEVMQWLSGKLNVPRVIEFGVENNREFVVMSELKGAHIDDFESTPEVYVSHLAKAIQLLHTIEISNCPFDSSVDVRLKELAWLIQNNLASLDDWGDATNLKFSNPNKFYQWLCNNKPAEEFVFSHGDITANFFVNGQDLHFYDLGRAGIADRWYDIAFCINSIRKSFGDKKYEDMFFDMLKIQPNYEKIDYFILLDAMF